MEALLHNYLGIGIMVIGGLVALLGVLLLLNHSGGVKIALGLIMGVIGLAGVGIGYTLDQGVESEYTVSNVTQITERDNNNQYRVTLKSESGTETWIYVDDSLIAAFPTGEKKMMTKREIKSYRDQESK